MSEDEYREIDAGGDDRPEVIIKDTNGDSVYVRLDWIIYGIGGLCASICAYLVGI